VKFKVGDVVIDNFGVSKYKFIIKTISDCRNREECLRAYGKSYICPGYVNDRCFGRGNVYHLKKIGISNPNNNIIVKETYE